MKKIVAWDMKIVQKCNNSLKESNFVRPMQILSALLGPDVWSPLLLLYAIYSFIWGEKYVGFVFLGNILQCWLLFDTVKHLSKRLRPYLQNSAIVCYDKKTSKFCFPSGHATFLLLFWLVLGFITHNQWIFVIGVLLAIIVSISRIFLGVHFPTDVIIGFFFTWFTCLLFQYVTGPFWIKILDYII